MSDALGISWSTAGWIVVNAIGIYVALIVYTRLAGLRSFAKMSSFDFAMTVAVGSIIASTVAGTGTALAAGVVALAAVYVLQMLVARLRLVQRIPGMFDNDPLLLMIDGEIIEENLRKGKVTRDDLRSKLREANVLNYAQVRAVVMEATGDVVVLHSTDPEEPLDPELLQGVRGVEDRRDRLRGGVEQARPDPAS